MHTLVAFVVFALGLAATLYYWDNLQQNVEDDMQAAYARRTQAIQAGVMARLQLYESVLSGSAGLANIHTGLTQAEWDAYHAPYNIEGTFPDIEGIGLSSYLTESQLPAYLAERAAQGESGFTVFPAGERNVYVPVTFNAQYIGNNGKSRGYDGYTDPTRRKAMDEAIQSGKPAMSGSVTLVSESRPARASVLFYFPIYRKDTPAQTADQRRQAITGFAYAAIDLKSFVDSVLERRQSTNVGLRLYDAETAAPQEAVYESSNFASIQQQDDSITDTDVVDWYGHRWRVTFAATADLISVHERQLPTQALWRGLLTCIFFAGLVWYLITDRERKYARQKQEEVQTAKDDLLSLASHQLRTPATVVKQYVGMLLQGYAGTLTKQQTSMLSDAYESNERQLEIINQLLHVARLDAGHISLRKQKVDIPHLISDVARDHAGAITARKQRLTLKLPKRTLLAEVDPHYMRMVLENLLGNAVKYTPEEGSITIGARRAPGFVIIRVSDNGVGIDPGVQPNIFEKFTRAENELSTDVNGSGVGLYLTKQIVELHGGTIEVDSDVGVGSTFTVRLPARSTEGTA